MKDEGGRQKAGGRKPLCFLSNSLRFLCVLDSAVKPTYFARSTARDAENAEDAQRVFTAGKKACSQNGRITSYRASRT